MALSVAVADLGDVRNLSEEERKALAGVAARNLSAEDKQALIREFGVPSQKATNFIWGALVIAIALVLVGSAGAMAWVFIQTQKLDPGAMLTVFTTVMGFIAGLLIKSPTTT